MRINLALIISIVVAVGIIALGFSFYQVTSEKSKLKFELESRTAQVSDEIILNYNSILNLKDQDQIDKSIDSILVKYQLLGFGIYISNDSIITNNLSLKLIQQSLDLISQAMTADSTQGSYNTVDNFSIYQYIRPIEQEGIATKSLILIVDTEYIDSIVGKIWTRNFLRWFLQALLVSLVTVIIIRWGIFSPIQNIVEWVKDVRSGNPDQLKIQPHAKFLEPLQKEIISITKEMQEAKAIAEEEAKLRSRTDSIWTPEKLKAEVNILLQNRMMVVVSNREPYMHIREGNQIKSIVPASGMVTAMEPILKACGGLWIASGTGDADKETVDSNNKIQVPPENPKYTLRRLWQSKEEEDHFYYGFSNEGLWPLCHIAHTRPVFRKEDWKVYKQVNQDFAQAVLEETVNDDEAFILIQDYHFALLPEMIKREKPKAKVAIFWHIPWPNPESFGICPWQQEILTGMLGADLIGFHTQYHCNHFLQTVNSAIESRVKWDNFSVNISDHTTFVKPFPISIAFSVKDNIDVLKEAGHHQILKEHGIEAEFMGIGVDRIDYTKGIVEKFLSIERFFDKYPDYTGRFTFVQIGAPSRTLLKNYSDTVSNVETVADRINWKFKSGNWKPILLLKRHHSHDEILPYYSAAHFCMVSSLHDGMNLVAKEFVASRYNNDGVLILSQFAGASQELQGAIEINPYDIEKSADAIKQALEMKPVEQSQRMKQMRQVIYEHNIYSWAADLIKNMASINNN